MSKSQLKRIAIQKGVKWGKWSPYRCSACFPQLWCWNKLGCEEKKFDKG